MPLDLQQVWEGGSRDDREPGDRPLTGNQLVRRWVDGRGVMGLLKYAAGSAAIVALACCHSAARAQSNSGSTSAGGGQSGPLRRSRSAKFVAIEIAARRARYGRPQAPPPPAPPQPTEVVVTADREPEPISRTGSSISVVKGETLATSNPGSLVDVLRTVPGLDISPKAVDRVRPRTSGCAAPIPARHW